MSLYLAHYSLIVCGRQQLVKNHQFYGEVKDHGLIIAHFYNSKGFRSPVSIWIKGTGQIYLKSVLRIVLQTTFEAK